MKSHLSLLLGLTIAFAAAGALAADLTARAALSKVLESARLWNGDARIVSLSALNVRSDGTAAEWKYSVYSPKTDKRAVITARGMAVSLRDVRLGESKEVLGEFIDSDRALLIAQKNGLRGGETTMAVKSMGSGNKAGVFWVVAGGVNKGDTSVTIVAYTGEVFATSEMP